MASFPSLPTISTPPAFPTGTLLARLPQLGPLAVGGTLTAIWVAPGGTIEARATLTIFLVAVVVWIATELDDTLVALVAAIAAIAVGGARPERLFDALGTSTVWLLVASFVVAAALTRVGLVDRLCAVLVRRARTVTGLFRLLAAGLGLTALVLPATSGRAALALPLFVRLARAIDDEQVTRALALLFPTVILLSAAGSLLGAGAHLVTAEIIAGMVGTELHYGRWLLLGGPFAVLSTLLSTEVVLRGFLDAPTRGRSLDPAALAEVAAPRAWRRSEVLVGGTVVALAALWATSGLHGIDHTVVALLGAVAVTLPAVGAIGLADAVEEVPWHLVLFLAATLALGESLLDSGAASWLADAVFADLDDAVPAAVVVVVVAVVSLSAHLVIGSRSARASVLTPLVVVVGTATDVDPAALAFLAAIGTGYCLTLTVSAKPVALFARSDLPTFSPADLLRLSAVLLPIHLVLLTVFALFVWPLLGLRLR